MQIVKANVCVNKSLVKATVMEAAQTASLHLPLPHTLISLMEAKCNCQMVMGFCEIGCFFFTQKYSNTQLSSGALRSQCQTCVVCKC